ncbi:hypothetical protein BTO04_06245 [Polaribacter sp. SA4-10]|uniref:hypothetical protein n=1 Tax=Polaribacter sp. SA4-10 TaxID=754397 RepID=UPI000B3D2497|nr:hypothetical protein [Polaribacter sp. SA4-10]ARV06324.1 hypothetical protein BTO04_06245 [Polaribacter sp. SA4-10]
MPVIKEQDLGELYSELDSLKVEKENLQAGFIDLKMKSTKIEKQNKRNIILLIIAAILLVGLFVFLYFNYEKN